MQIYHTEFFGSHVNVWEVSEQLTVAPQSFQSYTPVRQRVTRHSEVENPYQSGSAEIRRQFQQFFEAVGIGSHTKPIDTATEFERFFDQVGVSGLCAPSRRPMTGYDPDGSEEASDDGSSLQ